MNILSTDRPFILAIESVSINYEILHFYTKSTSVTKIMALYSKHSTFKIVI